MLLQPRENLGLAVSHFKRFDGRFKLLSRVLRHFAPGARRPGVQLLTGIRRVTAGAEQVFLIAVVAQLGKERSSRTLGGRSRIIQLMRQVGRELPQRGELLSLLLHARNLTHPVQQGADTALTHGRDGL